jgi:hypothetical protein
MTKCQTRTLVRTRLLFLATAFIEASLKAELAKKDKELQKAECWQDSLRQKIDREKGLNTLAYLAPSSVTKESFMTLTTGVVHIKMSFSSSLTLRNNKLECFSLLRSLQPSPTFVSTIGDSILVAIF